MQDIREKLAIFLFIYFFYIRVVHQYFFYNNVTAILYLLILSLSFFILVLLYIKAYINFFPYLKHIQFINVLFVLIVNISGYIFYYFMYMKDYAYINIDVIYFQMKVLAYIVLNVLVGISVLNILKKDTTSIFLITWVVYALMLVLQFNGLELNKNNVPGLHLLLGDTFAVITILGLFSKNLNKYIKVFLVTFSLFLIYTIKSRATFYSFIVIYILFLFNEFGFKNLIYLLFLSLIVMFSLFEIKDVVIDKRMFGILNGSVDGSLSERILQFKSGIVDIENNFLFGKFSGQMESNLLEYTNVGMGSYIHSALSYWRQFGLIFFLLFIISYLYPGYKLYIYRRNAKRQNNLSDLLLYLYLFSLIELLLFRSYTDSYPWLVLGMLYTYIYLVDQEERSTNVQ